MPMDPNHPNTQHLVALAQEIWGQYIRTHGDAEIVDLNRRVEQNRQFRSQLFGRPRPVPVAEQLSARAAAGTQAD